MSDGMHPSFILLFAPLGMAMVLKLKLRLSLWELLSLGFVVGSLTVAQAYFLLEQWSNTDDWMAVVSLIVFGLGSWWLLSEKTHLSSLVPFRGLSLAPLMLMVVWLSRSILYFDQAGNLMTGWRTVWGDWAAHLSYTTSFVTGNTPAELPILSGHPFSYPFLSDYLSSIYLRLGIDLIPSLVWPSVLAMTAVCLGLVTLSRSVFDKEAPGVLASYLLFGSGGLGWLFWLRDLVAGTTSPTREYTFLSEHNIQWINKFTSELLPQRGLVFALPVGLLVLTVAAGVWRRHHQLRASNLWLLLLLPLTHVHSLVAGVAVLGWSWLHSLRHGPLKDWLFQGLTLALVLGVSLALVVSSYGSALGGGQFLSWQLGWMAGKDPWIWFWILNLGLIWIPILLGWLSVATWIRWFSVPFWMFFASAQVIRFHPWEYDNTKVLTQWYLGMVLIAGWWLWHQWSVGRTLQKTALMMLVVGIMAAGVKDSTLIGQPSSQLQLVSALDLPAVDWAKVNLPPDAVLALAPVHDHPLIVLAGQTAYLGFPGWVWSYGLSYHQREVELKTWYHDGFTSQSPVTHVILGPAERSYYQVESLTLTPQAKELYVDSRYQIYSLK